MKQIPHIVVDDDECDEVDFDLLGAEIDEHGNASAWLIHELNKPQDEQRQGYILAACEASVMASLLERGIDMATVEMMVDREHSYHIKYENGKLEITYVRDTEVSP